MLPSILAEMLQVSKDVASIFDISSILYTKREREREPLLLAPCVSFKYPVCQLSFMPRLTRLCTTCISTLYASETEALHHMHLHPRLYIQIHTHTYVDLPLMVYQLGCCSNLDGVSVLIEYQPGWCTKLDDVSTLIVQALSPTLPLSLSLVSLSHVHLSCSKDAHI